MVEDIPDLSYLELDEAATRVNYIDEMLKEQGWKIGQNCVIEDKVAGIDSPTGDGYSDYVLYDKDRRVLAVVEAKRTCINPLKGYAQARAYADYYQCTDVEHRRPVVYLSNGLGMLVEDGVSPIRSVSGFYSQDDLHTFFNLKREMEPSLISIEPDHEIAGRKYQIDGIKHTLRQFSEGRRRSLLIMATGSGKTRVAASISDILIKFHWAKNVLFFADRKKLVEQAHDRFEASLPIVTRTMMYGDNPDSDFDARVVISTYPSMAALLNQKDTEGRRKFSPGHFQLIVLDEVHRSVYNKYRKVFEYFDARVVGLTATPRTEVDMNTFDLFEVTEDNPPYEYKYDDGVSEGYLKPYTLKDIDLKFYRNGIRFDELTPEEQEVYRKEFVDENGEVPEFVPPRDFLRKIISADSIRKVIDKLWKEGLRIDGGTRLGKTIIFASSHSHAVAIQEEFYRMLPGLPAEYCAVIDYQTDNGGLMKEFTDNDDSVTRIAISVDMLDTGVDVPCILNLVFFKPVYSRIKFWQMIGRGTRPCKGLIDGEDKDHFLIFDFCGNFKFFDENPDGVEAISAMSLTEAVFNLRIKFIQLLQSGAYQEPEYVEIRDYHVKKAHFDITQINLENYDIGTDRAYIDTYSNISKFEALSDEDVENLASFVAPHIQPIDGQINWERFDNLMLSMSVTSMLGRTPVRQYAELRHKMYELYTKCASLGQVKPHLEMIRAILNDGYIENRPVSELENIREKLRKLMDLVKHKGKPYYTTLTDNIVGETEGEFVVSVDPFRNFSKELKKAIIDNIDCGVIKKIHTNEQLTDRDIIELKDMLWSEPEYEEEYLKNFGDVPLPLFVRRIVGIKRESAESLFSKYIDNPSLSEDQIFFVKEIVEHIIINGVVDKKKLGSKPFTNRGNINEVFKNEKTILSEIICDINCLNENVGYDGLKELSIL